MDNHQEEINDQRKRDRKYEIEECIYSLLDNFMDKMFELVHDADGLYTEEQKNDEENLLDLLREIREEVISNVIRILQERREN